MLCCYFEKEEKSGNEWVRFAYISIFVCAESDVDILAAYSSLCLLYFV